MNETAKEWFHKAEKDWQSAQHELTVPNYDLVCFLCQQCIEKWMKGLLLQHQQPVPRTHNLQELSELLKPFLQAWQPDPGDLSFLTRGAVEFRYPGEDATPDEAADAIQTCQKIRQALQSYQKS